MRLTSEQKKLLTSKLNDIWKEPRKCSVCMEKQWNISDTIFELREFNSGSIVIGGDSRIYPVITLTCAHCGNTIFLNAISLGVVAATPASQEGDKK
jgi:hypothetical protein